MPFAELDDVRIWHELSGNASLPVLVLSNSLGTNLTMWDPQVPEFAAHFRVLRYDTRGHGRSSVPPGPYTIEQLSRDVLGLLDKLEIAHAHFCGLSMGGMIGQWLGANVADRLFKLVIANSAAKIGTTETWNTRISTVQNEGMWAIVPSVLERWYTPAFRAKAPDVIARTARMLEGNDPAGYAANCAAVRDMDQRESIQAITVPTLIITGVHDPVTPPAEGRFLARHIRGAQYVELEAAHLSNVERGNEFTSSVLGFLIA